jgi:hypothetical protein
LREDVPEPQGGAVVVAAGQRYVLDAPLNEDPSQSVWTASRG